MTGRQAALLILWVSAAAGTVGAASAPPQAGRVVVATATVSADQAVRLVEQRFHARVLKAQTTTDNGHTVYVMRLLNDAGKVWTVRVDATSGSVQ
jgi:uncharacterized membrane protein YkoI